MSSGENDRSMSAKGQHCVNLPAAFDHQPGEELIRTYRQRSYRDERRRQCRQLFTHRGGDPGPSFRIIEPLVTCDSNVCHVPPIFCRLLIATSTLVRVA